MENEIFKLITQQGIWAVLFLWLFFNTMKKYEEREEKLYGVIDSLTEKFDIVSDIKEDIKEVKEDVEDIKKNIDKM